MPCLIDPPDDAAQVQCRSTPLDLEASLQGDELAGP
jgi:hypothetical protein